MQLEAMKEDLPSIIQKHLKGKLNLKEQIELSEQLADEKNTLAGQILHDAWE